MFKPMVMPRSSAQKDPAPLRIDNFLGVDYLSTPTQVEVNRSPDMLNMTINELGKPEKRVGYGEVFATSLGTGQINGMFQYKKKDGTTFFLIAHGTKLYKLDDLNDL